MERPSTQQRERMIGCWVASKWTKIVGWLQIVGNVLLMVLVIVSLILLSKFISQHENDDDDEDAKHAFKVAVTILMVSLTIRIILSILAIIMATILLKGTAHKRAGYLKAWIIYTIISFGLKLVTITMNHSTQAVSAELAWYAGNVFSIYVVNIHMNEIKLGVFGPHQ